MKLIKFPVSELFLFGAGASYGASRYVSGNKFSRAPLDSELIENISALPNEGWIGEIKNKLMLCWVERDYILSSGFENALKEKLSDIEMFESILRKYKPKKYHLSKYDLLSNVSKLLYYMLGKANPLINCPYSMIVNKFIKSQDTSARFITFNYDTLLDKYLLEKFDPEVVYFDKINHESKNVRRKKPFNNPLLIKMHGSINWWVNIDDYKNIITDNTDELESDFIRIVHRDSRNARLLKGELPLIIPPMPNKPIMNSSILNWLWIKSAEYINQAKIINVCGYSLPDADTMALSLFKNSKYEQLKKVRVVDPSAEVLAKWHKLIEEKSEHEIKWEYYKDLDEFTKKILKK